MNFYSTQAAHVKQCRKESLLVIAMWFAGLLVTGTIAGLMGYPSESERLDAPSLMFGMPAWVFWAVVLPWVVQIGVTWYFALCVIKDDEPFVEIPQTDSH